MINFLETANDFIWGTPFILFVMLVGLYFTVRSGFFPIRRFGHIMKHTLGGMKSKEANEQSKGNVSPFQAACIAIGGSVGAANIAGVATAIATGGPGSVFWLWLWAFFGMMVKLVETTLGVYYRSTDEKGNYYGGSMYYMEKGIGREMGKKKLGGFLAGAFSICFIVQFIQGSQAYTISEVLRASFGLDMIATTVVYTLLIYFIVWRGTPRIAKFASMFVPFMCLAFLLGGVGLIVANIGNVPRMFGMIFTNAFTGTAAFGGFLGATVSRAISAGVSRSINSNEAGQGSSPLIHGSAETVHPMRQGLWGSFEVFIDTLVVCTITALSVLCTGIWETGSMGATLTIQSYQTLYGQFGTVFIGIMVILFGLTTTAGWYTYYQTVWAYLLRHVPVVRDRVALAFKIIFPLMNVVIVSYIVLSGSDADLFWTLVSLVTAPAVFVNLFGLFVMRKKFFQIFNDYKARYLGDGQVDPNFHIFYEDDPEIAKEEEAIREELREKNRKALTKS